MATYLYRIARFSYRRRGLVLALWLVLLAGFGVAAATLSGPTSGTFSIPGTESQQAIDLLGQKFPQANAGGATARVVFAAPPGATVTDQAGRAAITQTVAVLKAAPQVGTVTDPFTAGGVNQAGTVAYSQVTYTVAGVGVTDDARQALTAAADKGRAAGLTVEISGDALQAPPGGSATEVIGVLVAAVVLVVTFGSLVAAGLPLLTAIIGIGIGISGITAASGFVGLAASTPILALMVGLAVAIDYALFVVSRYRHELSLGREGEEAAGRAGGTAGSAVVFAGLTVVIALTALAVVNIPVLTQMGIAAAFTVAVAVLIALTLLPALLGFAGRRVTGRRRATQAATDGKPTAGTRWARIVTRRPAAVVVVAVLALGVIAIPALSLRLGLPGDGTAAPDTTQRKAYDLLSTGFGPGFNGPLVVVVTAPDATTAATQAAETIKALPDVATVTPPAPNPTGDTALLTVIPASGPSSAATEDLVTAIRDLDDTAGGRLLVTGQTALDIDISAKMGGALVPYLAVVVGLAFILLTLVFRSLVVPLKATIGFLLSVAATFGVVVAVFQWGWLAGLFGVQGTAPITSLLPVLLIGIVFGLAMDYEVFLVTRMREEYVHGAAPRDAVVTGFGHGARVVTAAALIMISVFSGFILSPEALIKPIGLALASAILFDAFVVRMTIVPAVMALLGRHAWWLPNWLDRILPNVDVEGERLRRRLDDTPTPEMVAAR